MKKKTNETIKITLVEVFTLPQEKDLIIVCSEETIAYLSQYHPEVFGYITSFVEEHINYGCILRITLPCMTFDINIYIKDDYNSKVLPSA
ncbi:MAG TPA: hypothetical protein DHW61_12920 [Lachnoclostridium phytofermentans]|uniref:Uncharacterized protein n=1 Tax=Lachnoclostridium phytofermentans TaxID=66219 RepID=A0A3D2X8P0_9FIRM|nr:hypothetical protein [Lachnoclostridium sp.]HCL03284.1 hypothetical protein [Lachnoclostridium phytofermentans]